MKKGLLLSVLIIVVALFSVSSVSAGGEGPVSNAGVSVIPIPKPGDRIIDFGHGRIGHEFSLPNTVEGLVRESERSTWQCNETIEIRDSQVWYYFEKRVEEIENWNSTLLVLASGEQREINITNLMTPHPEAKTISLLVGYQYCTNEVDENCKVTSRIICDEVQFYEEIAGKKVLLIIPVSTREQRERGKDL